MPKAGPNPPPRGGLARSVGKLSDPFARLSIFVILQGRAGPTLPHHSGTRTQAPGAKTAPGFTRGKRSPRDRARFACLPFAKGTVSLPTLRAPRLRRAGEVLLGSWGAQHRRRCPPPALKLTFARAPEGLHEVNSAIIQAFAWIMGDLPPIIQQMLYYEAPSRLIAGIGPYLRVALAALREDVSLRAG